MPTRRQFFLLSTSFLIGGVPSAQAQDGCDFIIANLNAVVTAQSTIDVDVQAYIMMKLPELQSRLDELNAATVTATALQDSAALGAIFDGVSLSCGLLLPVVTAAIFPEVLGAAFVVGMTVGSTIAIAKVVATRDPDAGLDFIRDMSGSISELLKEASSAEGRVVFAGATGFAGRIISLWSAASDLWGLVENGAAFTEQEAALLKLHDQVVATQKEIEELASPGDLVSIRQEALEELRRLLAEEAATNGCDLPDGVVP